MDCPDQSVHTVNIDPGGLESLQEETCDSGYSPVVISASVSRSVCGLPWLQSYIETLAPHEKRKVVHTPSSKVFNFRKLGQIQSVKVIIPLEKTDIIT